MHAGASEIDDCLRARDQTNANVWAGGSRKSAQFHGTHFSTSNPFSEIGVRRPVIQADGKFYVTRRLVGVETGCLPVFPDKITRWFPE
jgi:hypothetical protein